MTTGVRYLPWCRRAEVSLAGLSIRVAGRDVAVPVSRYGPGDVIGMDAGQIVRREPTPHAIGFLPNLFPFVEFRTPDLPWQLTPGTADVHGRLPPWLALVIRDAPGVTPLGQRTGPLPVIEVPANELPRVDELALWSHVQVTGDLARPVASLLDGAIARVVAPRVLESGRRYLACLVPCFEAGRLAGLGEPVPEPRSPAPAWGDVDTVLLPVYDHWLFTTSEAGDFETLGRRIAPRVLAVSDPPWRVDTSAVAGDGAGAITPFMTALVPPSWSEIWAGPAGARAAERLGGWLEQAASTTTEAPVIGPPLYGGLPAGVARAEPGWLAELNLDPRSRAAAALGAEAVRRNQEDLAAEAWRQLGHVRRANRERDLVQLGTAVSARWTTRHLRALDPHAALIVGAPAMARVRRADRPISHEVSSSAVPQAMLSTAWRRLAAVHGRAAATNHAGALARASTRVVPIGQRPPVSATLATVTRVRAILGASPSPTPPPPRPVAPRLPVIRLPFGLGRITIPSLPLAWSPIVIGDVITAEVAARRSVIDAGVSRLRTRVPRTVAVTRPRPLALDIVGDTLMSALGDTSVLERRLGARMDLGQVVGAISPSAPLVGDLGIGQPLAELLRAIDPRYLAAGVSIEPDSVGLLTPNAPFLEAVLVGANHELVGELRWRGAAVDSRATPLRRFFDVRGRQGAAPTDIGPVAAWSRQSSLGSHLRSLGQSVIIFRGELIRRFADPIVYAARAQVDRGVREPSEQVQDQLEATFRGFITDDTLFVGFDRTPAELRTDGGQGWYIVLAERPSGPRFGLDEAEGAATTLATWNDVAWSHVAVDRGHVHVGGRAPSPASPGSFSWGQDGAHMAAITMQRPVRFAFHARDLLPDEAV